MPSLSMVVLRVKLAIAAIPAFLKLTVLGALLSLLSLIAEGMGQMGMSGAP